MDYPSLTIANVGEFLRLFREFNEIPVFIRLCNGDHAAACMLKELLVWNAGVSEFYHTAERWQADLELTKRQLKRATDFLREIGLVVELKPIDHTGMRQANHYSIEAEVFWMALMVCLHEWRGIDMEMLENGMSEMVNRRGTKRTTAEVQNVPPQRYEMYHRSLENLNNESKQFNLISLPAGGEEKREREIYLLDAISKKFSNYERHREALNEFVKKLGEVKVRAIIQEVEGVGVDWMFVINRLNANGGKTSPNSAPPPPSTDEPLSGKFYDFFDR
jgi:hypothetical protein